MPPLILMSLRLFMSLFTKSFQSLIFRINTSSIRPKTIKTLLPQLTLKTSPLNCRSYILWSYVHSHKIPGKIHTPQLIQFIYMLFKFLIYPF